MLHRQKPNDREITLFASRVHPNGKGLGWSELGNEFKIVIDKRETKTSKSAMHKKREGKKEMSDFNYEARVGQPWSSRIE
jgi:hypothetical protein